MFKDLPEGETHSFDLKHCEECNQMTNHLKGICQKHPQNTQSVEEIAKGIAAYADPDMRSMVKSAAASGLATAIESERNRILKLLPPEKELYVLKDKPDKSDESKAWSNVNSSGYNDYRREVLQALNPK